MSKKANRARRRYGPPRLSAAQMVQPSANAQPGQPPAAKPAAVPAQDLRQEYQYVASDLKRVAIIAAAMLLVMVVLAIVLL